VENPTVMIISAERRRNQMVQDFKISTSRQGIVATSVIPVTRLGQIGTMFRVGPGKKFAGPHLNQ
jgi:hypothetical protein